LTPLEKLKHCGHSSKSKSNVDKWNVDKWKGLGMQDEWNDLLNLHLHLG
jgi:hypothetical protein